MKTKYPEVILFPGRGNEKKELDEFFFEEFQPKEEEPPKWKDNKELMKFYRRNQFKNK